MAIVWPRRPDGSEVPTYRRSWMSRLEDRPVFCAADTIITNVNGKRVAHYQCGYCLKMTSHVVQSRNNTDLPDCTKCGYTNRVDT